MQEGFRGLSVEAVRQRAGVGKATIYRRFPDKEALVRAAVAAIHADLKAPDTGSLRGDVQAIWERAYSADASTGARVVAPLLLAESASHPEMHAIFRSVLIEPRREEVRQILRRAKERGEIRDDADLEMVIDLMAGSVIYRLLIDGGDPAVIEQRGPHTALDMLLDGIAPRERS